MVGLGGFTAQSNARKRNRLFGSSNTSIVVDKDANSCTGSSGATTTLSLNGVVANKSSNSATENDTRRSLAARRRSWANVVVHDLGILDARIDKDTDAVVMEGIVPNKCFIGLDANTN